MARLKIVSRWKRKSTYKKALSIFTLLLVVLGIAFLIYVYKSMVVYERNLVDNYIKYLCESGKIGSEISDNEFEISKYEVKNASIKDGLKKLLKSKDITYKKNSKLSTEGIYAYDIYNKDLKIATVELKEKNSYTKMAILTITEWDVVNIDTDFKNGIYSYEISIPSDYKLYINNIEVSDGDILETGDVKGLERLTEHVSIAPSNTYNITNLVYEPKIIIKDKDGNNVSYKAKDNKIVISPKFKEYKTFDEMKSTLKESFDVLKLAEDWSLFLTDDLNGSYHGFNKLTPYLIDGTYMYKMAYNWSHNVDITFVSNHRLKNPVFTNESVEDCIAYNDLAFSCVVKLEKNMIVNREDKVDKMNDRLYFIYYNNGYKLVDMEAIR